MAEPSEALWLRLPEVTLERKILEETPLGATASEVQEFIREEGWDLVGADFHNAKKGFLDQRVRPYAIVGQSSIRAELGRYFGFPFWTYVTAFWGFDSEGKLIAIWVWKTVDGF